MHFKEIETKYRAEDIKLVDFVKRAEELQPTSQLQTASFDHYYAKDDAFIRYRAGSRPELTMKVKSKDANNFVRVECNLPLEVTQDATEQKQVVEKFCQMLGFSHNFSIYKTCFIYFWGNHNLVYYVVYDSELKEKDRFIEIELNEKIEWTSEEDAWNELVKIEKNLESVGIKPQRRIRLSLFEMFKK